jgi:hypothetical protein
MGDAGVSTILWEPTQERDPEPAFQCGRFCVHRPNPETDEVSAGVIQTFCQVGAEEPVPSPKTVVNKFVSAVGCLGLVHFSSAPSVLADLTEEMRRVVRQTEPPPGGWTTCPSRTTPDTPVIATDTRCFCLNFDYLLRKLPPEFFTKNTKYIFTSSGN